VRIWLRTGPGRTRVLALYAGLLLVTATATGGPPTAGGRLGWLPAALNLAAAACCAAVPAAVSYLLSLAHVTEKAISKHSTSIFAKLCLPPSDDDNRRVLAVLAYLNG
jgi:hypothetical protein